MVEPLEPISHTVSCLRPDGLYRMAYVSWGDPRAQHVIVCVHGLSRQGRDFDVLARDLCSRAPVRVVCPDVLGRGRSQWLRDPSGYQVPAYVADKVTLLAHIQAEKVDWVGTSMGGLIGMSLASLPGHPVRRLVLNDVGPAIRMEALQRIGTYLGKRMTFASAQEAIAYLREVSAPFGPHDDAQWLALSEPMLVPTADGVRLHYDPAIAVPFRQLQPQTAPAMEAALWQVYDRMNCPVRLLRGGESDLLSESTALEMTRRGPRAELFTFDGVGHAPTLVDAAQVGIVRDFLLS